MSGGRWNRIRSRLRGLMFRYVHGMITCAEFERFILDYLDGELPSRQRRIFEWHLALCRECREYLAAYRQAVALGRAALSAPDDPVPPDVPEDLVRAILDARDRS